MNATDVYIYPGFNLNQRPEPSLGFEKLVKVLTGKMFLKFSKWGKFTIKILKKSVGAAAYLVSSLPSNAHPALN